LGRACITRRRVKKYKNQFWLEKCKGKEQPMLPHEQNRKVSHVTMITGQCHGYVQVKKNIHIYSHKYMSTLKLSLILHILKILSKIDTDSGIKKKQ
jgi:hypothetical protein